MVYGQCCFDLFVTQTVLSVRPFSAHQKSQHAESNQKKKNEQGMPHRKIAHAHILCLFCTPGSDHAASSQLFLDISV